MAKSSEKPRLQQIPSSEDMEAEADHNDPSQNQMEPSPAGGSTKEAEQGSRLGQPQEEHVLQQVLGRGEVGAIDMIKC